MGLRFPNPQAHMTASCSSWYVPDKYKMKIVRNPTRKMLKSELTNWGRANGQTGGGAKSAVALIWIDLQKFCQGKYLRWHPTEFKKVCKYGAAMHIEGARSLWRKITRSGGLRSSNWLSSQLENLTRLNLQPGDSLTLSTNNHHRGHLPKC